MIDKTLAKHADHTSEVRLIKYGPGEPRPVLWCLQCVKHIKFLSKQDFETYKSIA